MVLPDMKRIKKKKFQLLDEDLSKQYMLFLFDALDEKPIKNKANLMKMLFFISLNVPELKQEFNFEADKYGPSSDIVDVNLEVLNLESLIRSDGGYRLIELGKEYLSSRDFKDVDFKLIENMKELFDGLSVREACALTYFTFPETTTESLIKDDIIQNREKLALSLFKKDKVSLEKASEIAGLHLKEFSGII